MKALRFSPELRRILDLPLHPVWDEETGQTAAEVLTRHLRKPGGEMELRSIQGAMLAEFLYAGGLVADVQVGGGKALASLLFFQLVDAKRGLLFVPSAALDQTINEVIPEMQKHWKFPTPRVHRYWELSQDFFAGELERLNPDAIALDEVQMVAGKSGRNARLDQFMRRNPHIPVAEFSGTFVARSIREMAKPLNWALGEGSPLPRRYNDIEDIANCVDLKVRPGHRVYPGVLHTITDDSPQEWCKKRINATAGVVVSWAKNNVGVPLLLTLERHKPALSKEAQEAIEKVHREWRDPKGLILPDAVSVWRIVRQLSLGFYYKWETAAPEDWLEARQAWNRFVQHRLKTNRAGLVTPKQVATECDDNGGHPLLQQWRKLKSSFRPVVQCHWIDHGPFEAVCKWMRKVKKGLVWVEHRHFARRLVKEGFQYFGGGEDAELRGCKTTCALSVESHHYAKNLQRFNKNLLPTFPSSAKKMEQLLGRTHRGGQKNAVHAEIWCPNKYSYASFTQLQEQTQHLKEVRGVEYKLTYTKVQENGPQLKGQ